MEDDNIPDEKPRGRAEICKEMQETWAQYSAGSREKLEDAVRDITAKYEAGQVAECEVIWAQERLDALDYGAKVIEEMSSVYGISEANE